MELVYADADETTINVTLDAGETLGHLVGPTTAFVPTDPMNVDYDAILAGDFDIAPYAAPTPSASAAIADSAQSLELSNAKSLAAQGRTDEALAALINLMEKQT
jgi:hypothetical protein